MAEVFKTFAIALDTKVASYVKIPVIEGDTGNRFVITLTDDGTAVDLSTSRVTAVFSGAMGTAMQDSWTSTGGLLVISGTSHNIITFDLLSGSYANGLNKCELQIYSGATYTTLITSASFNFDAKRPIINDDTIASTSEYPILVSLIDQVEALADREQSDWDETDNTKGTFINNKIVAGTDFTDAIPNLTAETTLSDTDTVPFYDASATAHRKSTWANIIAKIRTALFGSSTGILKADGSGAISVAAANTDFAAASHASRHASGAADAITPSAIGAQSAMTAGSDYADPTTVAWIVSPGVFDGGVVAAQGTPDQTVSVTACNLITPEGKRYAVSAVSALAATAADATNPRIDIVYATSAGVVTYLAGTAAASPAQPSTPANGTILAAIARAANDNTIATSDITDQRDFITTANDFEDVTSVTENSNAFACDLAKKHTKNFSFSITNATGKTVTFDNVPYGTCDVILTIKATGTAAVTWTLDGRTLVWPNGAPTLTSGYTYLILFTYSPLLGKWMGFAQAGGAN